MQLTGLHSGMSAGGSGNTCFGVLLIRIILDVTLGRRSAALVALLGFFLQHAF
jgi:hypothetical protein